MDLICDLGFTGSKPFKTPMDCNTKLTTAEYNKLFKINQNDSLIVDPTKYRRFVGRLLYLTVTRPDIAFNLQYLSQFMQEPKQSH